MITYNSENALIFNVPYQYGCTLPSLKDVQSYSFGGYGTGISTFGVQQGAQGSQSPGIFIKTAPDTWGILLGDEFQPQIYRGQNQDFPSFKSSYDRLDGEENKILALSQREEFRKVFVQTPYAGLTGIFERPNKKSEETRKQEEEKDSLLKTIGEQKVEIDFLKKVQADIRLRSNLVEPAYKVLSISRQCKLLGISRSQYYYEPHTEQEQKDFDLLVKIKEVQIEHPYYGYRKIWREINKHGGNTTETTVHRVMRRFGITAIFPGRNLSKACRYHKKYPYLLKNKVIRYPNQVW